MKLKHSFLKIMAIAIMPFQMKHQADTGSSNALIKLGAFVTDIRGKVGGTIFSRNKGGAYAKNRVIPSNPQTSEQQAVRAVFGFISSSWRTLPAAFRSSWDSLANQLSFQNAVGDAVNISGLALYQKFNGNLNTLGQSLIAEPKPLQGTTATAIIGVDIQKNVGGGIFLMDVSTEALSDFITPTQLAVFATPPLSPGISNFDKYLRLVEVVATPDFEGPIDLSVSYVQKYGEPAAGKLIGFAVLPINSDTGEAGVRVTKGGLVVEI
jgi:hypothetical protein